MIYKIAAKKVKSNAEKIYQSWGKEHLDFLSKQHGRHHLHTDDLYLNLKKHKLTKQRQMSL